MNSGDDVRTYLRNVDETVSGPVLLGEEGHRLLSAVENRLSTLGTIRWEPVGSACCGTSLAGFSDVDMLAVFLDPIRHGIDSSVLPYSIGQLRQAWADGAAVPPVLDAGAAYDLVAECLDDLVAFPSFAPPVRDFPAVRFPSRTGEPSVEVVPSLEADILWDQASTRPSSGLVRVAFPARRDRWLGTEPQLHSSVLDFGRCGADYSVREMIRLLKLIKYRRGLPVLSYFLEVFALRWLEGSEAFAAKSIADIVEQHGTAWSLRPLGLLVDDLAELITSLAAQLRAAADGRSLTMIDLTTPEMIGTVDACVDVTKTRMAADLTEFIADAARLAARAGDSSALARWRTILEEQQQ